MARYLFLILGTLGLYDYLGDFSGVVSYYQTKRTLKEFGSKENLIKSMAIKVNQDKNNPHAWYLLGRLYTANKQWPKAMDAFNKAINLAPENADYKIHYSLVNLASDRALDQKAHYYLNIIIKNNPKNIAALNLLALAAEAEGNKAEAIKYRRQQLAALPPESEAAAEILKLISRRLR